MAEELTYRTEGDYLVPNLTLPEEEPVTLGKYALLRKKYLKENHKVQYVNLLTAGTLNQHLTEIEQAAQKWMEMIVREMAEEQGVNEQMKAEDQMKWVGLMNNIQQSAEEVIFSDLIYA